MPTVVRSLLLVLALVGPAMAQQRDPGPVGVWEVRGGQMDASGAYQGVVEIRRRGEAYQVDWRIGGQTHAGTGFMLDDVFATSFASGGAHGVAAYRRGERGGWIGRWTVDGGGQVGIEAWLPRAE